MSDVIGAIGVCSNGCENPIYQHLCHVTRWYSPAYKAQNGNVIPFGNKTINRADAVQQVDEFNHEETGNPCFFLAYLDLPEWRQAHP